MAAPADTKLETNFRWNFTTGYKRTDLVLSPQSTKDNLDYRGIAQLLRNGRGNGAANLQFYDTRRLIDASETLDLDGVLTNKWGQTLDFDAVKILILRNTETAVGRYLKFTFKDEAGNISQQGYRILGDPGEGGIEAETLSGSQEEGLLTITAIGDVTYEVIIIGSDREESTTSGS